MSTDDAKVQRAVVVCAALTTACVEHDLGDAQRLWLLEADEYSAELRSDSELLGYTLWLLSQACAHIGEALVRATIPDAEQATRDRALRQALTSMFHDAAANAR